MTDTLCIAQMTATELLHPNARFDVNVSTRHGEPCWARIEAVQLGCDTTTAEDYDCDGTCIVTLHIQAEYVGDATVWHMDAEAAARAQFRRAF